MGPIAHLQEIDAFTLHTWLSQEEIVLIDVRSAEEYAEERISGGVLIPHTELQPEHLPKGDRKWVLYCRSGNRSAQAARKLLDTGLKEMIHLKGGILAWKVAGYETTH